MTPRKKASKAHPDSRKSGPRKPKNHEPAGKWCYAGIDKQDFGSGEESIIYIGGRYYGSTAQIHLDFFEARRLAKWLTAFADWADAKKGGKR